MSTAVDPFEYHKPSEEQQARIEELRSAFRRVKSSVDFHTKPGNVTGRYAALARTALEEACMWAVKAIVFEGDNEGPAP